VLASAADRPHASNRRPWVWWYGAAAAIVIVVAGVIAATMLMSGGDEGSDVYVKEFETGSGVSVRFEVNFGETASRATFRGLESRENYHLWAIRGEDWLSIGTFRSNPEGRWSGDFEFQMRPGDAVCLTVAGESEHSGPFGEPIFIEDL
jgi:anti-sigma-K factor RskA